MPVPAAKAVKLGGRAPTVTKLLLNGVDTSTPSPMKRAASAASNKATRHIVFPLPAGAASGDLIDVQTELGTFQLVVPPSAHTALEADLPVPTDCELPALTVAWVRLATRPADEATAAPVDATSAAPSAEPATSGDAPPRDAPPRDGPLESPEQPAAASPLLEASSLAASSDKLRQAPTSSLAESSEGLSAPPLVADAALTLDEPICTTLLPPPPPLSVVDFGVSQKILHAPIPPEGARQNGANGSPPDPCGLFARSCFANCFPR